MKKIPSYTLALFCLPAILQAFMHGPAGAVLQGIYAKHFELSLTALATGVLIARVFDAVTDPVIGYMSDRTQEKLGTRKPWLIAGMIISVISVWFLFRPPEHVSSLYFTTWFVLSYLGWTLIEIPYRSWSIELSPEYNERTRVVTWVAVGTVIGGMAFFSVPLLSKILGVSETAELTPATLAITAVFVAVGLPVAIFLVLWKVPNAAMVKFAGHDSQKDSVTQLLASIFYNKPFIYITLIFMLLGIASGLGAGLLYLYIDAYLGLGTQLAGLLMIAGPLLLITTPFWGWVCTKIEKHKALAIGTCGTGICFLLYVLVPTDGSGMWFLAPVVIVSFAMQSVALVAFPAIMGDISDYGKLKFCRDRTGTYFAVFTMIQKALGGLGVALGLYIASVFGFDAAATEQSEGGIFSMQLTMSYLPAAASFIAVPFLWYFPLNKIRQDKIRQELSRRASL